MRLLQAVSIILASLLLVSTLAMANNTKVFATDSDDDNVITLAQSETEDGTQVTVEAKANQLIVQFKQKTKKSTIDKINQKIDATIIEYYESQRAYLIEIPSKYSLEEAVDHYKDNKKYVEYVEPNFVRLRALSPDDTEYSSLWNLDNTGQSGGMPDADIDAPEAWDVVTDCSNVIVGVMDDGIDYLHEDLADNVWINEIEASGVNGQDDDANGHIDDIYGYDFGSNDADPYPDIATDESAGHGTHVAGIIGAEGDNGLGTVGICWNVKLMALKIFDEDGHATVSDIIEAANYAIWMKDAGINIKVINMSFGSIVPSSAEFNAMKSLRNAGILVSAAAGNTGSSTNSFAFYPASYAIDNIISVAASNDLDKVSAFSTFGTEDVDIAAPGSSILSTYPTDQYILLSGTSMAAPHVAGVAALLSASDDDLDYAELRSMILSGTDKKTLMKTKVATSGRLNAYGALQSEPSLPDFVIKDIEVPETSKPDAKINVKVLIENKGETQADTTTVKVFASDDQEDIINDDFLVGTILVGSLKADEAEVVSGKVNIPNALPVVYVAAVIDYGGLVSESDNDNNISDLKSVLTTDLDLSLVSVSTKSQLKKGKPFSVSFSVRNSGGSDITDGFAYTVYLSKNKELDDSDVKLSEQAFAKTLSVKKSSKLKQSTTIPIEVAKGAYYILVFVDPDNEIAETKENNNLKMKRVKVY